MWPTMTPVLLINSTAAIGNSSGNSMSTTTYSTRNLFMGVAGLTANLGTMLFLVRIKDIKNCVKISLLSLILSNVMTLSAMIISGALMCLDTNAEYACLPILYLIIIPTTVMYFMLAQQSLYLYAAMFYPVRFRIWPKVKISVFCSVFGWTYALVICTVSVRFSLPQGLLCLPWLLIRGVKVIGIGSTIVISSIIVLFVNFRVILQIRKRLRLIRSKSHIFPNSQEAAFCGLQTHGSPSSGLELPTNSNRHQLRVRKSSSASFKREVGCLPEQYTISTVSESYNTALDKGREMNKHFQNPINATDDIQMHVANPAALRCRDICTIKTRLLKTDVHPGVCGHLMHRNNTLPSTNRRNLSWRWRSVAKEKMQFHPCGPKMRKNVKVLIMFTLLCCFLNLPYSIFFIWLAFISEERAFEVAQSLAGVVASSLNVISCIVSPLLYVCGFVDWSKQLKKQKGSP